MCNSAFRMTERRNYENDRRSRAAPKGATLFRDDGTEIELPTRWEVCGTCGGEGSHVAPAIDCDGLTSEDFANDPDFAETYFGGAYDVTCSTCHGRTTVRVADTDAMSDDLRAEYQAQIEADRLYDAEVAAERRMGC